MTPPPTATSVVLARPPPPPPPPPLSSDADPAGLDELSPGLVDDEPLLPPPQALSSPAAPTAETPRSAVRRLTPRGLVGADGPTGLGRGSSMSRSFPSFGADGPIPVATTGRRVRFPHPVGVLIRDHPRDHSNRARRAPPSDEPGPSAPARGGLLRRDLLRRDLLHGDLLRRRLLCGRLLRGRLRRAGRPGRRGDRAGAGRRTSAGELRAHGREEGAGVAVRGGGARR